MYISLALYFSHSPAGIITGLQLISLQTQTRRNKMLKTKITEKLWSKNGNGKRQLACAHNFPERRTCRKWQLLAFDCFTDDVNDVSTHRLPPPPIQSDLSSLTKRPHHQQLEPEQELCANKKKITKML